MSRRSYVAVPKLPVWKPRKPWVRTREGIAARNRAFVELKKSGFPVSARMMNSSGEFVSCD